MEESVLTLMSPKTEINIDLIRHLAKKISDHKAMSIKYELKFISKHVNLNLEKSSSTLVAANLNECLDELSEEINTIRKSFISISLSQDILNANSADCNLEIKGKNLNNEQDEKNFNLCNRKSNFSKNTYNVNIKSINNASKVVLNNYKNNSTNLCLFELYDDKIVCKINYKLSNDSNQNGLVLRYEIKMRDFLEMCN